MLKRALPPLHPGELIREEVIEARGLTIVDTAMLLGVSRQTLSNIVNEKAGVTTDMALRLSMVFGGSAEFWLRIQSRWDLYITAKKFKKNVHLKPFIPTSTSGGVVAYVR